jgi:hypothetical protein
MEYLERKDWDMLDVESLEAYLEFLMDSEYVGDDIDALFGYIDNLKEVGNVHVFDLQDADD